MQGAICDAMCNIKDPTSDKLLVMADGGAKRSTVLGVWQQTKHCSKIYGLVNINGCYKKYPKLSVRYTCFLRSANSKNILCIHHCMVQPITGVSCFVTGSLAIVNMSVNRP